MNLVFVTPPDVPEKKLLPMVEEALEGGADAVQLRRPGAPARELFPLALLIRRLTERAGASLFINDRADVALAAGATGVHLAGFSLPVPAARVILPAPSKLVGVSCHSVAEAAQAQTEGADYVFLGTIFPSPSKPGANPIGVAELGRARAKLRVPIVAIGGINVENVGACLSAGADGVAVVSAIAGRPSPRDAARALADAIRSWKGGRSEGVEVAP